MLALLLCTSISYADSWPENTKYAYIDRCSKSLSSQGLSVKNAKKFCTCTTNGMEDEFGMKEYNQMMKAQPNPNGSQYDRRLFKVYMACNDYLPK